MTEVHFLAGSAQSGDGEEHKCDTEEEIADVAVLLAIDKQQRDEEHREHDVGHVEREAKRHDPCRERGADVGSHDNGDGLCQCEQSGVNERYCHHRRGSRRLHRGCYEHTGQQTSKAVGSHCSKDMAQLRACHLLECLAHHFHAVNEQS